MWTNKILQFFLKPLAKNSVTICLDVCNSMLGLLFWGKFNNNKLWEAEHMLKSKSHSTDTFIDMSQT